MLKDPPRRFVDTPPGCRIFRIMFGKVGESSAAHMHNEDHTTLVTNGRVRIVIWGSEVRNDSTIIHDKEHKVGDAIPVRGGHWHQITALEDSAICWCVFSYDPKTWAPSPMSELDLTDKEKL